MKEQIVTAKVLSHLKENPQNLRKPSQNPSSSIKNLTPASMAGFNPLDIRSNTTTSRYESSTSGESQTPPPPPPLPPPPKIEPVSNFDDVLRVMLPRHEKKKNPIGVDSQKNTLKSFIGPPARKTRKLFPTKYAGASARPKKKPKLLKVESPSDSDHQTTEDSSDDDNLPLRDLQIKCVAKKSVKDTNLESGITCAYSHDFISEQASIRWKKIESKPFVLDRPIKMIDFAKQGLVEFLRERKLLKSCTYAGPFVENVVKEFYCNILKDTFDIECSEKYGKVYLRNKTYDFSPAIVNSFLELDDVDHDDVDIDEAIVVSELTGNTLAKWPYHKKKKRLSRSKLTSEYAVLHKVAMANWVPSSSRSIVTKEQGMFLFKIGMNYTVNFGEHVCSIISTFAEKESIHGGLFFPSLIYSILVSQGFKKKSSEVLTKPPPEIQITFPLLSGNRMPDLATTPSPTPRPSSNYYTSVTAYLERQVKHAEEQIAYYTDLRDETSKLLCALHKKMGQRNESTTRDGRGLKEDESDLFLEILI